MAVYRIYRVYDGGHLEPGESFYCPTDAEALSRLRPSSRVDVRTELWQGGRCVAAAGHRRPSQTPGEWLQHLL
jgi:hypothetical protein